MKLKSLTAVVMMFPLALLLLAAVRPQSASRGRAKVAAPSPEELKEYQRLKGRRQTLIDRWAAQIDQMSGKNRHPATVYATLSLSRRTTYEAITHSLMKTQLSDDGGRKMGTALDLVAGIEDIAGEIQGLHGDKEYRLYVTLEPNAVDTLGKAKEFVRDHDNTVFHKGFPVNFRLRGQAPTSQFSISEDGRHADIDVDYRSSKVPQAIWDGHLRAANSDVRAGANYVAHLTRWAGLEHWWPFARVPQASTDEPRPAPGAPAVAKVEFTPKQSDEAKKVSEAMEEFLRAWLVRQDVKAALLYISEQHVTCSAKSDKEFQRYSYSEPPVSYEAMLKAGNEALGKTASPQDVLEDLTNWDPGPYFMTHTYEREFLLRPFSLKDPSDRACLPQAIASGEGGDAFATYVVFKVKGHPGSGVRFTWAKEDKHWRIINTRMIRH